jgi:hypothetical protein
VSGGSGLRLAGLLLCGIRGRAKGVGSGLLRSRVEQSGAVGCMVGGSREVVGVENQGQ